MSDLPSACVIGAGSSGIAAAKALLGAGIPFDCFEKSYRAGGNWVFANKNGMSSAYRSWPEPPFPGQFDGRQLHVWCTGYKVSFPFFEEDFISAPDNDLPLFRRVFKPGLDNLFFIALLQPLGATMPIAEAQGRWVAAYLRGEYHLPPRAEMEADVERERRKMFKRYVPSKRHTMEVDFDAYLYNLRRERGTGAHRARAAGFRLPVPPRAAAAVGA